MADIPQHAVDAAAAAAPPLPRSLIQRMLEAAECAWPHDAPRRSPESATAAGMNLAAPPALYDRHRQAPPMRPAPFGFGPPGAQA